MVAKLDDVASRVGKPQILTRAMHHVGQRAPHRCYGTHRPEQVEDERHDDECKEDADESITCRSELGRCAEAFESHKIEGKRDLQAHVVELTSTCRPCCKHG